MQSENLHCSRCVWPATRSASFPFNTDFLLWPFLPFEACFVTCYGWLPPSSTVLTLDETVIYTIIYTGKWSHSLWSLDKNQALVLDRKTTHWMCWLISHPVCRNDCTAWNLNISRRGSSMLLLFCCRYRGKQFVVEEWVASKYNIDLLWLQLGS